MEIKATSVYDLKTVTALTRLNMFKKVNHKKRMRTFGIIDAILICIIVFELLAFGFATPLWLMLSVLIISTFLYSYMYFLYPKIRYKASGKFADIKNHFVFYDDELAASTDSNEYNGTSTIKYTMLYKVMETSEYFFLFQNKLSVYVVDKTTLQNGTADNIREKLLPILQKQYIVCKY